VDGETKRGAKILHLYIRTIKQGSNLVFDLGLGLVSRDASRSVRECYSRTTVGMDVTLRLRNFKGYGLNGTERGAKVLDLYIRTIKQDSNLVFDLGLGLMSHAMRAGAFGNVTIEDLWASKSTKISVDAPFLNCPIFRSLASRGFGLETAPLRWSSAATGFRPLCDKSAFRGEQDKIDFADV